MRDTIFALASAPGRGAVGVMRISGAGAGECLSTLSGQLPPARRAVLRKIGFRGDPIDEAIILWFPGPASFTGEDVAELHIHGGLAISEAVAEALRHLGARPAEPGEFTRRAFEAGRLELSQAEAVADLVDAETQAQRRQALAQLDGAQHRRSERWRDTLLTALAFLEAQIDFPDEDVPPDAAADAFEPLRQLDAELAVALADARGERIREGVRIAIVGASNAGKSSLLNALTGRAAAIVTPVAGTTRDVIEVGLILNGYKVTLADTAGLRVTHDVVEVEGVRRARAWAEEAHLRLLTVDPADVSGVVGLTELAAPGDFLVITKRDLGGEAGTELEDFAVSRGLITFLTTTADAHSITRVRDALGVWAAASLAGVDSPTITRERHRRLLEAGRAHLQRALSRSSGEAELVADDVRLVVRALECLSGRIDAEAVLDRVFASFCIGK